MRPYLVTSKPSWKYILDVAFKLVSVIALIVLIAVLVEVRKTVIEYRYLAVGGQSLVAETHKRVVDTSQNLNAVLIQAGLATDQVRRASEEQRKYFNRLGSQSVEAMDHLNQILTHVDQVLTNFDGNQEELANTLHNLNGAITEVQRTTSAAGDRLRDPNLELAISHVNEISKNTASISGQLNEELATARASLHAPKTKKQKVLNDIKSSLPFIKLFLWYVGL